MKLSQALLLTVLCAGLNWMVGLSLFSTAASADDSRPIILLTGFEPFGPSRPANSSWEGIRELHETHWHEYRIIAQELPVVWGEPLKNLQQLIDRHKPVAVFSFGQGGAESFAIESRAENERGQIPDNKGKLPAVIAITADGPPEFKASIDCEAMKTRLAEIGYPVRVSLRAGHYLCEETLYSLEYLHARQPELDVAFCHVPPLGATLVEKRVDAKYVQQFVGDYLEAWRALRTVKKSADTKARPTSFASADPTAQSSEKSAKATDPELPAVEKLIKHYFLSWSEQRMKDYGECFADGAVVQEINRGGEIYTQNKIPFVAGQAAYHKSATYKAVEVPVKTEIRFEADLARAVVYWKLTAGPRLQYGYDHFTLIKQGDDWKIVNLVFYGTDEKE
ncbi:MAG: nuclear transport factor 2 family protein [Planctomycetaceae bacterium]